MTDPRVNARFAVTRPLSRALALAACTLGVALASGCAKEGATNAGPTPAAASDAVVPAPVDSAAASPAAAAPGAPAEITVGKPAPEFAVKASDGGQFSTASLKGKPVVVYFYPKDETPGCTKE